MCQVSSGRVLDEFLGGIRHNLLIKGGSLPRAIPLQGRHIHAILLHVRHTKPTRPHLCPHHMPSLPWISHPKSCAQDRRAHISRLSVEQHRRQQSMRWRACRLPRFLREDTRRSRRRNLHRTKSLSVPRHSPSSSCINTHRILFPSLSLHRRQTHPLLRLHRRIQCLHGSSSPRQCRRLSRRHGRARTSWTPPRPRHSPVSRFPLHKYRCLRTISPSIASPFTSRLRTARLPTLSPCTPSRLPTARLPIPSPSTPSRPCTFHPHTPNPSITNPSRTRPCTTRHTRLASPRTTRTSRRRTHGHTRTITPRPHAIPTLTHRNSRRRSDT